VARIRYTFFFSPLSGRGTASQHSQAYHDMALTGRLLEVAATFPNITTLVAATARSTNPPPAMTAPLLMPLFLSVDDFNYIQEA